MLFADTGSSKFADTKARIMEAFYTTEGISCTGLDLWISPRPMQRHGVRIAVRSSQREEIHGTVFGLFLPFDGPVTALMTSGGRPLGSHPALAQFAGCASASIFSSWRAASAEEAGFCPVIRLPSVTTKDDQSGPFE